jgi:NAD(P)-dependent dehydrogenase (short-subunit alcohol dehydrogenase family)
MYPFLLLGAVRSLQSVAPLLKKSEQASVVLFSTVAATLGMPFHASIASSKAAVEGLVKSLAAEWAPAIRVNGIAPSLTNTSLAEKLLNTPEKIDAAAKRNPLQKVGDPKDIAAMAAFLLSPQAAWISGQILHVDGGMSSLKN